MRIAHCSDLQIRTYKRHDEFKIHFKNLYASLKEQKPDIIVFTGDCVHQKSNISPELIDILVDFFRNISSIAPFHIIYGNHDLLLNNLSRMDSLSPVFKALNNPNIYDYKYSGIFPINDTFNLVVFSCIDDDSLWPSIKDIDSSKINIGLFHGMLQGAILQNDEQVKESQTPYRLNNFLSLVDYLMLGDIHKHQILDLQYRAAYPGSLIQQNYGETIDKGYLIWDIKSKIDHTIEFIVLPNVCPFYTIRLEESLRLPINLNFQQKARIRVFSRQLSIFEKKDISDEIYSLFDPIELVFLDDLSAPKKQVVLDFQHSAEDILDVVVQEKLLANFFKEDKLSDNFIQKIYELNKFYHTDQESLIRNIQYKVGTLKFSNLFSFGENNEFNFSKHKGIIGIFGKNGVGKSSIAVDIPLYCLFNKISKKGVVKNDLLINENSEACFASLDIAIGSDIYKISRSTIVYSKSGKKHGSPILQGKTDVDFRVVKNGIEVELNGEERSITDENIRNIFGTIEDFTLTSTAPQGQLMGFIDAGSTERQKILGRYFDIDIFDHKHKMAKDDLRDLKSKLKVFENKNFQLLLDEQQLKIKNLELLQNEIIKEEEYFRKLFKTLINKSQTIEVSEVIKLKKFDDSKLFEARTKQKFLISNLDKLQKELESFNKYSCIINPDCCLKEKQQRVQEDFDKTFPQKNELETIILKLESTKRIVELENEQLMLNIRAKALDVKNESTVAEEKADLARSRLMKIISEIGYANSEVKNLQEQQIEYLRLIDSYQVLSKYTEAVSKDGIVKSIIGSNLELINKEIKKILSKGVNFSVELEAEEDGKAIEIYFIHERSKKRKIELCSGMEKSMAALAIRAALLGITSLPKSNILTLDESIGSLDPEYIDSFANILNYLKHLFDSVIIITHIETMKDLVDHVFQVERNADGISVLN